jgi:hypothetical protein
MKNYVGRKIRGFRFENGTDGVAWGRHMEAYIGKVGEVLRQRDDYYVVVEFDNDNSLYDNAFTYPISLIEPHLIEEETPEIPQLGEGILMEVSDNGVVWVEDSISAIAFGGRYVGVWSTWKHARPIQQLPKYTHAELVEKIGEEFEYINK